MTPQEQVKMLREALTRATLHAKFPLTAGREVDALITDCDQALAATAPPPAYREWGERDIVHGDPMQKGGARTVLTLMRDATQREREACLAALLALAEKEQAR